jgi:hypothetical protein
VQEALANPGIGSGSRVCRNDIAHRQDPEQYAGIVSIEDRELVDADTVHSDHGLDERLIRKEVIARADQRADDRVLGALRDGAAEPRLVDQTPPRSFDARTRRRRACST